MKKILLFFICLYLVPDRGQGEGQAKGSYIYAEPFAGIKIAKIEQDQTLSGESNTMTGDASGYLYGGRLFYNFGIFFLGMEYRESYGECNLKSLNQENEHSFEGSDFGGVLGFKILLSSNYLRFWGGYYTKSVYTIKSPSGDDKYRGTGYKAGIGLGLHPKISFNFEYIVNEYKKVESGGSTFCLPYAPSDSKTIGILKQESLILSISFLLPVET